MSFGVDPRNPTEYARIDFFLIPTVTYPREPISGIGGDYDFKINTIWRVGTSPTGGAPTTGTVGDQWILIDKTGASAFNTQNPTWLKFLGAVTPIIFTLTGDDATAVSAVGNNINVLGSTVVNATHAKPLYFKRLSAGNMQADIQVTTTSTSGAKSINNAGLASFDSVSFSVDAATGFISAKATGLANTITGDSGGALPPTANNWNILGRSGSKTSGSGSTLTVKSPPYADASATATSTLNSGEFVTGAFTRTLPVTAGVADGDLVEYACTSASALVIQASPAQFIRIGSLITSAAGSATSTAIGDSVSLRFRAADSTWYATSVIGTWLIA